MLANILYILSVVLPLVTAWVIDANKKLQAVKLEHEAAITVAKVEQESIVTRTRMSHDEANTRAKTADHDKALENALLEIVTLQGQVNSLSDQLTDHTKQISMLTERL